MEPRFGHDFSRVRVHTDARAAHSAMAVSALAYTSGRDIVFAKGQYAPGTEAGKRLLAHELAHVVQQASAPTIASGMDVGSRDFFEQAAERRAKRALYGPSDGVEKFPSPLASAPPIIQRYPVPASLRCNQVVDWLDNNSPYKPEWAETKCDYSFNGEANVSPPKKVGGGVQRTVLGHSGLTVSVDCSTDPPEWQPSPRPNGSAEMAAWIRMRGVLDKHEARHRQIGEKWRGTLEKRWQGTNFTVTGQDEADAMAKITDRLQSDQEKWRKEQQKAQDAIDPFRGAVLNCPAPTTEEPELRPAPENISPGLLPPQPAPLQRPGGATPTRPLSPELQKLFPPQTP
jgi:hypothetical protein